MPMFEQGFYYIDLEDTEKCKEYKIDTTKLRDQKEREEHFNELKEKSDRMPIC